MSDDEEGDKIIVEYVQYGPRGAGWYWRPNTTGELDQLLAGPFPSEKDAHHDIFLLKLEADGP